MEHLSVRRDELEQGDSAFVATKHPVAGRGLLCTAVVPPFAGVADSSTWTRKNERFWRCGDHGLRKSVRVCSPGGPPLNPENDRGDDVLAALLTDGTEPLPLTVPPRPRNLDKAPSRPVFRGWKAGKTRRVGIAFERNVRTRFYQTPFGEDDSFSKNLNNKGLYQKEVSPFDQPVAAIGSAVKL